MAFVFDVLGGQRILFVHIPKTGGRSVREAMSDYAVHSVCKLVAGHPDVRQVRTILGASRMHHVAFALVRNPPSWRYSWYHYARNEDPKKSGMRMEHAALQHMTFKDSIRWLRDVRAEELSTAEYAGEPVRLYTRPQHEYVDSTVRTVKLESAADELPMLMEEFGIRGVGMHAHVGRSHSDDYTDAYDAETRSIVEKRLRGVRILRNIFQNQCP